MFSISLNHILIHLHPYTCHKCHPHTCKKFKPTCPASWHYLASSPPLPSSIGLRSLLASSVPVSWLATHTHTHSNTHTATHTHTATPQDDIPPDFGLGSAAAGGRLLLALLVLGRVHLCRVEPRQSGPLHPGAQASGASSGNESGKQQQQVRICTQPW